LGTLYYIRRNNIAGGEKKYMETIIKRGAMLAIFPVNGLKKKRNLLCRNNFDTFG
jgi:hypothetical protein